MAMRYDNDEERKLHLNVIHALADQFRLDEDTVREIYESKLEVLRGGARIRTYLSVLTARHVRNYLSQQRDTSSFH